MDTMYPHKKTARLKAKVAAKKGMSEGMATPESGTGKYYNEKKPTEMQLAKRKKMEKVKSLTNQEFNKYKLKSGEKFDFGEFRSAEVFYKTSTPIGKMIGKVKAILRNATKRGSRVIIVTARPNFDNRDLFLKTFSGLKVLIHNLCLQEELCSSNFFLKLQRLFNK